MAGIFDIFKQKQQGVVLNENQVEFLNKIFPGFSGMNESAEQMFEKLSIMQFSDPKRYKELMDKGVTAREDFAVAAAYGAIYAKITDGRKKVINEVDRMRNFYLIDVILTQITEDALSPEVGTGYIVNLESDKPEIQKELDLLDEKFEFDQLVSNITPDLLAYGEYTLATHVKLSPSAVEKLKKAKMINDSVENGTESNMNETITIHDPTLPPGGIIQEYGLLEVRDTVDQTTIVALTKDSNIDGYIVKDKDGNARYREPADFVKFTLGGSRIRININQEIGALGKSPDSRIRDIPPFVRVGKSIISPILSKLRELELLETLVPATKLSKLSSGTLIGVQVPPGYDVDKAMEAAAKVEGILNRKVGVDKARSELSIENIMSSAGRLKVVPVFGDKGVLSKMDYQSSEPDELLSSINDIRKVILGSIGVPPELLFGLESGSRGEMLKKYARYLRKLKAVQKALSDGLRQIAYIHLSNKGIEFSPSDIKISFYNKLVEIDNLDKLEFMDTVVQALGRLREFISEISAESSPVAPYVNIKGFVSYIDSQFGVIGLNAIINKDKDGNPIPMPKEPDEPEGKDGEGEGEGEETPEPTPSELPLPDKDGNLPSPEQIPGT